MAIRATRGVADDNHPVPEHSKTKDSRLAVVPAPIFGLEVSRFKHKLRILKVKLSLGECLGTLQGIIGDGHPVSVSTSTPEHKGGLFA